MFHFEARQISFVRRPLYWCRSYCSARGQKLSSYITII